MLSIGLGTYTRHRKYYTITVQDLLSNLTKYEMLIDDTQLKYLNVNFSNETYYKIPLHLDHVLKVTDT